MKYLAKGNQREAKGTVLLLLLAGVLFLVIARQLSHFRWVFDVGAIVWFTAAGYMLLRFMHTAFAYELEEEFFHIYRIIGGAKRITFSAPREACTALFKQETDTVPAGAKAGQCYYFLPSRRKKPAWILEIKVEEEKAYIFLDIDEAYAKTMEEWIHKKKD